jgi:hypothetical protein
MAGLQEARQQLAADVAGGAREGDGLGEVGLVNVHVTGTRDAGSAMNSEMSHRRTPSAQQGTLNAALNHHCECCSSP